MLRSYIKHTQSNGCYWFTKNEAMNATGMSESAFKSSCWRMYKKNQLQYLGHQFYIIIPLEYSHLGSLPPPLYIDHFLKSLGLNYYVALLSSAAIHGASHQQPQIFQVMLEKHIPEIIVGRSKVKFYQSKHILGASIKQSAVSTGFMQVASREQTIFDLMKFPKESGYLNNVARLILDLAEEIDLAQFTNHVKREIYNPILQRLGYICGLGNLTNLSEILEAEIQLRSLRYCLLRPELENIPLLTPTLIPINHPRDDKWHLIINDQIEIDE